MNPNSLSSACDAVVIGAGPAGLMAAQALAQAGAQVHVFDAMPSVGRKFLLAGKGGLNTSAIQMAPLASSRQNRIKAKFTTRLPYFPTRSTARNASCGISTDPTCFIRFLPAFCFSSSFFLREMSPP